MTTLTAAKPPTDWYAPLRGLTSLGATVERPGSLAGLSEARERTLGQFFTPDAVARFLWDLIEPVMTRHVTILDNSCGSGRLFQFADPEKHSIYGIEVHQPLADAVAKAVADAGFQGSIVGCAMEERRVRNFDVGLINPPFNLHIDSPRAETFASGSYGAYGPLSSHRSHRYALDQAREACDIVAAIMPASFASVALAEAHWKDGLHAVYFLPPGAFRSEGTEVDTCVLVYGPQAPENPQVVKLKDLVVPAPLGLKHAGARYPKTPTLESIDLLDDGPVITLPNTGDKRVRIVHTGRKLILKFNCGLAQAIVMNDLLGEYLYDRRGRDDRLPTKVRFRGQGVFDLQNFLAQEKPAQAYAAFIDRIRALGLQPRPDPSILQWLFKAKRRLDRQRTPFRKEVADPDRPDEWIVKHQGLQPAYPELWAATEKRAKTLGIHTWITRPYQWRDLIELAVHGGGAICAWDMGLGKARLAIALCLLGQGRRNLIVVEARLLSEMKTELKGLPLDPKTWQFIDGLHQVENLRQVNVISYSTLKKSLPGGGSLGRRLRRRFHTVICDEGHCLRNPDSEQTRAVVHLSPKIRYVLSGTPIANYPRDILPVIQWVAGDGSARQVFGNHHPFMHTKNLSDCSRSRRGIDVFRQWFVTTVWITNEFAEDLRSGAKREIPKIACVEQFRKMIAPIVLRRVVEEPDVRACVRIPTPTYHTRVIPWDGGHFAFYQEVSEQFVRWFRNQPEWQRRKGANLVAVLGKILGVQTACNFPQGAVQGMGAYTPLTSKQRYALDRLTHLSDQKHKTILFAHSPGLLDLFHTELAQRDIESVRFHGGIPIAQRIADLDKRFRHGGAPVLLASTGACQTGYNIHQADRIIMYDRDWTPKTEMQACARVLRPQQQNDVEIEFLHLEGSIDTYQEQMVAHKGGAMRAGLDDCECDLDPADFLHIDTILGRFVEDFHKKSEALCA